MPFRSHSQFIDAIHTVGLARRKGIALTEDELVIAWKAIDRVRSESYRGLRRRVNDLFLRQEKALVERSRKGLFDDFDVWVKIFEDALRVGVVDVIGRGYRIGQVAAGLDEIVAISSERAAVAEIIRSKTINDTTKLLLLRALEGQDLGNVDQVERIIRDVFAQMRSYRTDRIVQTMGVAAFESGQQEAYADAGIMQKRWLTQRDGRVRGIGQGGGHDEADGQVVMVGDPYMVTCVDRITPEPLMHPGDPRGSACNTINCRCTSLGVV